MLAFLVLDCAPSREVHAKELVVNESNVPNTTAPSETFLGVLIARRSVTLTPASEGRLTSVSVGLGSNILTGQVLARLESSSTKHALATSIQQETIAEAEKERIQLEVEQLETRLEAALRVEKWLNADERRSAVYSVKFARTKLKAATSQLAATQERTKELEEELRGLEVRAPIDGQVTEVLASPFSYVYRHTQLMKLAELPVDRLRFFVPASTAARLQRDSELRVNVPTLSLVGLHAHVTAVAAELDVATGDVLVEGALDVLEPQLRAGISCRVFLRF